MGIAFKISHIMTKDIISIESNASVSEVASIMTKNEVGAVVVTKQGTPVGIITEVDILKRCCVEKACTQAREAKEIMSTPHSQYHSVPLASQGRKNHSVTDPMDVHIASQRRPLQERLSMEQKLHKVVHQPFVYPFDNRDVLLQRSLQLVDFPRHQLELTVGVP